MMLDLGYQVQFLRRLMFRPAIAFGANVANSRHSMPLSLEPQAYLGYQGKSFGLAAGYAYPLNFPLLKDGYDGRPNSIGGPIIYRNHVVRGELSFTSRIDRVALTFAAGGGVISSILSHFDRTDRKWRPIFHFQCGVFFDGSIMRAKKKQKKR